MATSIKERRRHLAAWRTSGLSRAAYCKESGIPASRMEYWVRRERRIQEADGQAQEHTDFVEVTKHDIAVAKQAAESPDRAVVQAGHLILRFPSGHELQLPTTATPSAVAELTSLVCRC